MSYITSMKWRKRSVEGSLISVKDNALSVPAASEVKKLKKR